MPKGSFPRGVPPKGDIMSFSFFNQAFIPSDSYSRQLDKQVAADEYPYGYDGGEPAANHHNGMPPDEQYIDPSITRERKKLRMK